MDTFEVRASISVCDENSHLFRAASIVLRILPLYFGLETNAIMASPVPNNAAVPATGSSNTDHKIPIDNASHAGHDNSNATENRTNNFSRRKRKGDFPDSRMRQGGRGGHNDNKRHKKGDMGRAEYL